MRCTHMYISINDFCYCKHLRGWSIWSKPRFCLYFSMVQIRVSCQQMVALDQKTILYIAAFTTLKELEMRLLVIECAPNCVPSSNSAHWPVCSAAGLGPLGRPSGRSSAAKTPLPSTVRRQARRGAGGPRRFPRRSARAGWQLNRTIFGLSFGLKTQLGFGLRFPT